MEIYVWTVIELWASDYDPCQPTLKWYQWYQALSQKSAGRKFATFERHCLKILSAERHFIGIKPMCAAR